MTLTGHDDLKQTSSSAPAAVNPLQHAGWDALLAGHARATVFHGSGWARVLHETYGHQPFYFCRFEKGQLRELLPVMEVRPRFGSRRGVSLPFTDLCPALGGDLPALYDAAAELGRSRGWRYLEVRDGAEQWRGARPSISYHGHMIDLAAPVETLFQRMDSALRRGVRKAEASGLRVDFQDSPEAMRTYFQLHCLTRRRHGLPPQPYKFFANIQKWMLAAGQGFIALVRAEGKPVAAGIFFHLGANAFYKFGASDESAQAFRPNNLMMWSAMQQAAARGCTVLHLGRTSLMHEGLRRFKLAFGAQEQPVAYFRYEFGTGDFATSKDRVEGWFNHVFRRLPMPLLKLAGETLYPQLS